MKKYVQLGLVLILVRIGTQQSVPQSNSHTHQVVRPRGRYEILDHHDYLMQHATAHA